MTKVEFLLNLKYWLFQTYKNGLISGKGLIIWHNGV